MKTEILSLKTKGKIKVEKFKKNEPMSYDFNMTERKLVKKRKINPAISEHFRKLAARSWRIRKAKLLKGK